MEFVEGKSLHTFLSEHPQGSPSRRRSGSSSKSPGDWPPPTATASSIATSNPRISFFKKMKGGATITDFGIAQVIEEDALQVHLSSVIGTPPYMSPEAFVSPETVDGRSDIYSLGITFYQLLTGHLPFAGRDVVQLQRQIMEPKFEPPRRWNPSLRRDLEAVVLKCMAKEPSHRYETAAELDQQLGRWLDNEPVGAWQYTSAGLFRLWFQRNRWLAAFLATVAFLVIILALGQRSFSSLQAEKEQARQEEERAQAKVVDDYWNTAEGQHKLGRFGEAALTLEKAVAVLNRSTVLTGDRQRFESRLALIRRLDDFTRNSDHAWFFAGEERRGYPGRLRECITMFRGARSTRLADSRTCCGFARRRDRVRAERGPPSPRAPRGHAYRVRYHLLLASPVQRGRNQSAPRPCGLGTCWEPGKIGGSGTVEDRSYPGERCSSPDGASGLSGLLSNRPNASRGEANANLLENLTAEDGFFLGVMHVYFAKHQKDPFAGVIRSFCPGEFDFENPRDTAVEMLRHAVQLEPRQYWSSFMLGRMLAFRGPDGRVALHEALQTFNLCVSVRPDYSRGYEQRALTLVQLSLEATRTQHTEMLRHDAGADLAKALDLAPDDPSTHWVRGQAFVLLGDTSKALAAFTRAIELEDPSSREDQPAKPVRRPQRRSVKRVLETKPGDPAAKKLYELIERADKQ